MTLNAFQRSFQPVLDRAVRDGLRRVRALTRNAEVRAIAGYAGRLARHDGKRLRPYLAVLMYRASGGRNVREAMRLAAALELFHVFALVHDDIMDQGTLRHGLRTVHLEVAHRLERSRRIGDAARIGESQAILAGDLLFSWATEILASRSPISARSFDRARQVFASLSEEVILGQMLDVDLTTRRWTTRAAIIEKMRRKTAGYSFIKPLQFGAALAGADPSALRWCDSFGTALGLAFQIQDDLFDLTVPSSQSHKTPFSDLAERQPTVFTQYITDQGTAAERTALRRLFGKRLSERDRARVERLFRDSGALAGGANEMLAHFSRAEALVDRSPFTRAMRTEFAGLVRVIRNRTR